MRASQFCGKRSPCFNSTGYVDRSGRQGNRGILMEGSVVLLNPILCLNLRISIVSGVFGPLLDVLESLRSNTTGGLKGNAVFPEYWNNGVSACDESVSNDELICALIKDGRCLSNR